MILWTYRYLAQIPPMWLDGLLYLALAVLTQMQNDFSADDVLLYVGPVLLFWLKKSIGWAVAGALAVKLYRSRSFADHQDAKKSAAAAAGAGSV